MPEFLRQFLDSITPEQAYAWVTWAHEGASEDVIESMAVYLAPKFIEYCSKGGTIE